MIERRELGGRARVTEAVRNASTSANRLVPQKAAAAYLGVSVSYLRASSCPKVLLPGTGPRGKALVRYRLTDLDAWTGSYRSRARS
jgi:hypothetical protein